QRGAKHPPPGEPDTALRKLRMERGERSAPAGCMVGRRINQAKRIKAGWRPCDELFQNPAAHLIGRPKNVGCRCSLLPDIQDAYRGAQGAAGEAVRPGGDTKGCALRHELLGHKKVGGLKFGTRPERGGQSEVADLLVSRGVLQNRLYRIEAA